MSMNISNPLHPVELNVNGHMYTVQISLSSTLLEVLRENLGFTGTKEGCGEGQCGTCTVIIDGKPVLACLMLAYAAKNKKITTIEGLAGQDSLDPIQEAYISTNSVQCGFCTPGMIMTTKALLDSNPNPDEETVKEALSGNLCRCTGYKKIIEAVKVASSDKEAEKSNCSGQIGRSVANISSSEKVSGQVKFASDVYLPNMLRAKVLRSPHSHARIVSIDLSKAEALEGVRAVVSAADFSPENKTGYTVIDRETFARDKVRFYGEAIAAVAATTEAIAEHAISLIDVQYEVLPAVYDPEQASFESAPIIHENSNIASIREENHGDVEKEFETADIVVESRYEIGAQEQAPLEPEANVVRCEADGTLTCWASTHVKFGAKNMLAHALGISPKKIRIIVNALGGDFGGKAKVQSLLIAGALAKKAGRLCSVRYVHTRTEESMASTIRHPAIMYIKSAMTKDGKITARKLRLYANTGAYVDSGDTVVQWAGAFYASVYKIPHQKYEGYAMYTNCAVAGSMRGFGGPQQTFAVESHMDLLAEKIGISPIEIRKRNVVERGYRLPFGWELKSAGLKECLECVENSENWKKYDDIVGKKEGRFIYGRSVAIGPHGSGWKAGFENHLGLVTTDPSSIFLKLDNDGVIRAFTGETDHGTGNLTGMVQIIAEVLGANVDDVIVTQGDSAVVPFGQGAYSSRSLMVGGMAAKFAAQKAREKMLAIASDYLNVEQGHIAMEDSYAYVASQPENKISFSDIATISLTNGKFEQIITSGYYDHKATTRDPQTNMGSIAGAFLYNVSGVVVKVDSDTGVYEIIDIISASDCGKAINPSLCTGQMEGAISMGIGLGGLENMGFKNGLPLHVSLEEYKMSTTQDMPPMETHLVESIDPVGPFGAKGVAENPAIAVPSALAGAIRYATKGDITAIPLSYDSVMDALK